MLSSGARPGLLGRLVAGLNLQFPTVFLVLLAFLVLDLIVPDPIPFVDEIVLALLTVLFGLWRARRESRRTP